MNGYVYNRNCSCRRCRSKGIMGPAIMITVGILFLLDNFGVHGADFGQTWPVILLVIGIVKIMQTASTEGEHIPPVAEPRVPDAVLPPPNEVPHG